MSFLFSYIYFVGLRGNFESIVDEITFLFLICEFHHTNYQSPELITEEYMERILLEDSNVFRAIIVSYFNIVIFPWSIFAFNIKFTKIFP